MHQRFGLPCWCFVALLVLLAALLPAYAAGEPDADDILNGRLFPMKVGWKWIYEFDDKEVVFEVLRTGKRGDCQVFVVRRTIDKTSVEFKLAVKEHGVYIHQEGTKKFVPPLRQFAFFAREGDIWKWRGTVRGKLQSEQFENLGVQKVTVPAGTYSAIAVHQTNPETGDHATFWLAKGVGVVKLSGKTELLTDDPEGTKVLFEWRLKRFVGDAARLVEQLSNDDIDWDHRNWATVMPRIEGKTAKSILALGPKSKPALLKAMDDPKKFAAAHVLLSSIHKSNFPVVQSTFTNDAIIAFYNHMLIDFRATSIDFHPEQRTELKRFWKRELDGS